jgi:hypothetical protein
MLGAGLLLAGCESLNWSSPADYYSYIKVPPPAGNAVTVCHGYSCKYRSAVRFSLADLDEFGQIIRKAGPGAANERRGIATVIALIERKVGPVAGTSGDLGQLHQELAGRRGQQDCVDEATNTTSYLVMLEKAGFLEHHEVKQPVGRGFFLDGRWQHFAAMVEEKGSARAFVIDSWPKDNGKPPVVLPLKTWMTDYDTYA